MNSEFHVGDIVRVTHRGVYEYTNLSVGLLGRIARVCDEINDDVVSVNFEMSHWHGGHSSNGYFPGSDTYWNFNIRSGFIERISSLQPANIKELF